MIDIKERISCNERKELILASPVLLRAQVTGLQHHGEV
jgi:hypothetical protein